MKVKLGQRIKKLRKSLGLTQKQFANRIPGKIDYTYVGKIERGQQYPSLKLLDKIGKVYDVPLSYFFQGERERRKILGKRWLEDFERVVVQADNTATLVKRLQEGLEKLKVELPEPR